ncbi:unnamed protein product [Darwinula stevensoni]|uniref:L-serine deaminase n=1 Tax=Darwinula stevensoni TaxID=69355 RepID=A0A7R8XCG9_9CRUS|nr:unnamed protein product [Darwinula stevensoni]CAG0892559.1 unnamed protein product [Darwinula stevensoni]
MGLEIRDQVKNVDAVVIPVGGGGLIAGTALALKTLSPTVQIIGVEAEACPSFSRAMECGRPIDTKVVSSLADGLAAPFVGVNAFVNARKFIDKMVTVKEEFIAIAILRLVEMEKAVVEGAGAVGFAAVLQGLLPELKGKRVVIPLTGGNIDTTVLGRCLERGLAADGRLVKFKVTVSDRPGGIAALTNLICSVGVSIKDMIHERAWVKTDIFSVAVGPFYFPSALTVGGVGTFQKDGEKRAARASKYLKFSVRQVKVVVETRDQEHARALEEELRRHYDEVYFVSH